jgi:hypothetical protein
MERVRVPKCRIGFPNATYRVWGPIPHLGALPKRGLLRLVGLRAPNAEFCVGEPLSVAHFYDGGPGSLTREAALSPTRGDAASPTRSGAAGQ